MKSLPEVPYTVSYVIRKRQQLDSFSELGKEKKPPEKIIWDGTSTELDEWLDNVFKVKDRDSGVSVNLNEIE